MQIIEFDDGMRGYRINNGGVLRFNPADPNIYTRFMQLDEKMEQLQQQLKGIQDIAQQMSAADRGMKQMLGWVFGEHNDFDALLGGVSLLAVACNGKRVLTNLLEALEPLLLEGAESCVADLADQAAEHAAARREHQC